MALFVDTSAIFAFLDRDDPEHRRALETMRDAKAERLVTHNYVAVESVALIHRRLGWEVASRAFRETLPGFDTIWVDEALHEAARAAFLIESERGVSFVDCVSFELMRREGIETAFAFDADFEREGFGTLP